MSPIDLVILALVIAVVALCVRSLARSGGSCSSCASKDSCAVHLSGSGECPAAKRMLERADEAVDRAAR